MQGKKGGMHNRTEGGAAGGNEGLLRGEASPVPWSIQKVACHCQHWRGTLLLSSKKSREAAI